METINEEKKCGFGEEEYDDNSTKNNEEFDSLKKKIASHSLYGLLVQTHIDCLKLCMGMPDDIEEKSKNEPKAAVDCQIISSSSHEAENDQLELDNFMEAYCMALSKLKEVMGEPQQLEEQMESQATTP